MVLLFLSNPIVDRVEDHRQSFNGPRGNPWRTSENALASKILGKLSEGMLCLADRLFYSYEMWTQAVSTKADLL